MLSQYIKSDCLYVCMCVVISLAIHFIKKQLIGTLVCSNYII